MFKHKGVHMCTWYQAAACLGHSGKERGGCQPITTWWWVGSNVGGGCHCPWYLPSFPWKTGAWSVLRAWSQTRFQWGLDIHGLPFVLFFRLVKTLHQQIVFWHSRWKSRSANSFFSPPSISLYCTIESDKLLILALRPVIWSSVACQKCLFLLRTHKAKFLSRLPSGCFLKQNFIHQSKQLLLTWSFYACSLLAYVLLSSQGCLVSKLRLKNINYLQFKRK